jgi:hypothetical protein
MTREEAHLYLDVSLVLDQLDLDKKMDHIVKVHGAIGVVENLQFC